MRGNKGTRSKPKARKKAAKKALGVSKSTRQLVLKRAGGACERCGIPFHSVVFSSLHHRTPRGMGGTRNPRLNLPSNLVAICGSGTTGCHGDVESYRKLAVKEGYIVSRYEEPAEQPIYLHLWGWTYLTDEGEYIFTHP